MARLPAGPFLSLISDDRSDGARLEAVVEAACAAGCALVQLRRRESPTAELLALAVRLRTITRRHGALLAVNDRVDVALAARADAVHLPAAGMAPADARRVLDGAHAGGMLVGRSVHALDEIRALAGAPLDYLQFGPVFETASKAPFGPPQGTARLAAAAAAACCPVIAVGGIRADNAAEIIAGGAAGAAVIGAVVHAADAGAAAAAIVAALRSAA